jgi:hypothetical protein
MTNLLNKSSLSRSARLRKYEVAYEECIKKTFDTSKKKPIRLEPSKKSRSIRNVINNSPKKSRSIRNVSPKKSKVKQSPPQKKKRSLNAYQKFVKEESQKSKYKSFTASERMKEISKEWNKKKI